MFRSLERLERLELRESVGVCVDVHTVRMYEGVCVNVGICAPTQRICFRVAQNVVRSDVMHTSTFLCKRRS